MNALERIEDIYRDFTRPGHEWNCQECGLQSEDALALITELRYWRGEAERFGAALERLSSREGFEGALDLKHAGPDALSRELCARIKFAELELT